MDEREENTLFTRCALRRKRKSNRYCSSIDVNYETCSDRFLFHSILILAPFCGPTKLFNKMIIHLVTQVFTLFYRSKICVSVSGVISVLMLQIPNRIRIESLTR